MRQLAAFLLLTFTLHGVAAAQTTSNKGIETAIKRHIREQSEDGAFVLHDDKLDQDWRLRLLRLEADKLAQLSDKLFSVPASFKQVRGRKRVGVDFLVNKTETGWSVRQAVIRQVDGQARAAARPQAPSALPRPDSEQASYTCPMHPDVVSDKPGACPKCGMALQKK